ncbi:MAG: hypothetical protein IPP90_15880 [Gemmatimonadaceae bacterium]|nr:hypothetical protein [Gemmatimonadaceae bacterium]
MHSLSLRTVAAIAAGGTRRCPLRPLSNTAPTPASDPLKQPPKAGLFDAGEYTSNLKVVAKAVSAKRFLGETNS